MKNNKILIIGVIILCIFLIALIYKKIEISNKDYTTVGSGNSDFIEESLSEDANKEIITQKIIDEELNIMNIENMNVLYEYKNKVYQDISTYKENVPKFTEDVTSLYSSLIQLKNMVCDFVSKKERNIYFIQEKYNEIIGLDETTIAWIIENNYKELAKKIGSNYGEMLQKLAGRLKNDNGLSEIEINKILVEKININTNIEEIVTDKIEEEAYKTSVIKAGSFVMSEIVVNKISEKVIQSIGAKLANKAVTGGKALANLNIYAKGVVVIGSWIASDKITELLSKGKKEELNAMVEYQIDQIAVESSEVFYNEVLTEIDKLKEDTMMN